MISVVEEFYEPDIAEVMTFAAYLDDLSDSEREDFTRHNLFIYSVRYWIHLLDSETIEMVNGDFYRQNGKHVVFPNDEVEIECRVLFGSKIGIDAR